MSLIGAPSPAPRSGVSSARSAARAASASRSNCGPSSFFGLAGAGLHGEGRRGEQQADEHARESAHGDSTGPDDPTVQGRHERGRGLPDPVGTGNCPLAERLAERGLVLIHSGDDAKSRAAAISAASVNASGIGGGQAGALLRAEQLSRPALFEVHFREARRRSRCLEPRTRRVARLRGDEQAGGRLAAAADAAADPVPPEAATGRSGRRRG